MALGGTGRRSIPRRTVLLAALGAAMVFAPAAWSDDQIKIGVLQPLSGPMAAEGRRQLNGMEIVRDMVNERGGIGGKQLAWVVADAPDATAATNEAARLISQEGVKLLSGTLSSSLCVPASEVAARNNIVYWEVSCVDPRFNTRGYKNVFRTEIDANGFGWYNIEFIRDTLHKKLGIELKDSESRLPERGLRIRSGHDRSREEARAGTGDDRSCRSISTTATR